VLEEIRYLYENYSVRGINFIDDNLTFDKIFITSLCGVLIQKKDQWPDLLIATPNGISMRTLDDDVISLMKQAGWDSITIAPESGVKDTLKRMKKNISIEQVRDYVFLIKKYDFKLFAFFIIGYPGETVRDILKTISFACSLPFDQIAFSPFTHLPGTPIHDRLVEQGDIDREYSFGDFFKMAYSPKGISLRGLSLLHKWALFRSILLSPKRLFFMLRSYSLKRLVRCVKLYYFRRI
jgi:radical SAM superfamily enzyme YgiQ (UPF0313 family)